MFESSRSGANTASATPCGGSWLKLRLAVPKAMSRSTITVAVSSLRAKLQARLWAMVEAPTPPLAPTTATVRPTGSRPAVEQVEIVATTSRTPMGAMRYSLTPAAVSSR
jgi:hypothetical protein